MISSQGFLLVQCEVGVVVGGWVEEDEGRVGRDNSKAAADMTYKRSTFGKDQQNELASSTSS